MSLAQHKSKSMEISNKNWRIIKKTTFGAVTPLQLLLLLLLSKSPKNHAPFSYDGVWLFYVTAPSMRCCLIIWCNSSRFWCCLIFDVTAPASDVVWLTYSLFWYCSTPMWLCYFTSQYCYISSILFKFLLIPESSW